MLRITELRACGSLFLDLQYDGNRRRPHGARSFAKGKFQSLILWNKTGRIRQCNSKFSTAVFVNLVPRAFPLKNAHFGGEKPWGRGWVFVNIQQNPRVKTSMNLLG